MWLKQQIPLPDLSFSLCFDGSDIQNGLSLNFCNNWDCSGPESDCIAFCKSLKVTYFMLVCVGKAFSFCPCSILQANYIIRIKQFLCYGTNRLQETRTSYNYCFLGSYLIIDTIIKPGRQPKPFTLHKKFILSCSNRG